MATKHDAIAIVLSHYASSHGQCALAKPSGPTCQAQEEKL
jgi:hypothetical protein